MGSPTEPRVFKEDLKKNLKDYSNKIISIIPVIFCDITIVMPQK